MDLRLLAKQYVLFADHKPAVSDHLVYTKMPIGLQQGVDQCELIGYVYFFTMNASDLFYIDTRTLIVYHH